MKNKNHIVAYLVIPMSLINHGAYWILWSMIAVIDYTANCNVLFYLKIASKLFKKLTCLSLFEIKIFLPATTDFLPKFSSPILEGGMQMSWHC